MALLAGLAAVVLGGTSLAGWLFKNDTLKNILPGSADSIVPGVALGMLLCGATISLLSRKTLTRPIRICAGAIAGAVITLSGLPLAEYFLRSDLGIDGWLMGNVAKTLESPHPGRVMPITAVCFAMAATALLTASRRVQKPLKLTLVAGLGGIVIGAGAIPLLGYFLEMLFGASWNYMGMGASSVPIALAFFLLGSGLLAVLRGNAQLQWSLSRRTTAGFVIGFVLMNLGAGLTYNFTLSVHQTAEQVRHAQQVLTEIEEIEARMLTLENQQRSYVITGNERLLEEWDVYESELRDHIAKLQKLAAKDFHQQPRIRQLTQLSFQRVGWAEQIIAARRQNGFNAAQDMVASGAEFKLLAQSREVIDVVEKDEHLRLDARQSDSDVSARRAFLMLPLGIFLCMATLSLGLFFLNAGTGERRQAERSLRQSEEGMRAILNSALDCIITTDHHGRVLEFNPAAEKTFGYRREEAIGQSLSELILPRERHQQGFERYLATGDAQTMGRRLELTAARRDGSEFPVEMAVSRIGTQEPPVFTGFIRDITERQAAAEKLDAQGKQYRLLFEDNPTPMWVFDVQSLSILAVNQAAILSYGYSRDEFLSLTLRDIRPPGDVPALEKSVSGPRAPSGYGGEWRHMKKDGSVLTAAVYSSPTTFEKKEARIVLALDRTESAEAEGKLRESEANLALAQQVAGVGSWEYPYTADGEMDQSGLIWSREAYRLFGLSSDVPITTETFFAAVHPADRALVIERFSAFEAGGGTYKADHRIFWPDGTERTLHNAAEKIFDPHTGKPLRVVGTVVDITERLAAEKQLREAEEKYRSIFDNALEGIFQNTPDGAVISANPALARMLGFASPEELIRERQNLEGQSYLDPAKRQEFRRLLEEKGVVNNFEYEVKRKDGSTICVSENVRVVRDAAGRTLYYEGTMQDITDHKRAEASLIESAQRLVLATEAAKIGIWDWDVTGNKLSWDAQMYALYGIREEDFSGAYDAWQKGLHPEDLARGDAAIAAALEGTREFDIEFRVVWPNSEIHHIQASALVQRSLTGAPLRMIGANLDITDRKRAEEFLAERERRFRFLNDLGNATRSLSQPKEIMAATARLLGTQLHVSRCAYAEMEKEGDRFTIIDNYVDGCASIVGQYSLADFGEYARSELVAGRTLVLRDVDAELTPATGADTFNALEIKAAIACPLLKNGRLLAIMAVHHLAPRQWTAGEIALVQEVIERCGSVIERARAELILRASEEHLRLVIAASNDGIFEHDYLTGVITWSDRMYEMLGLDQRTCVPTMDSLTTLLHPDDRAPFQKGVAEQMAHGGRYEAKMRILRRDGSYGNFLGRGRAVLDPAGRPIRVIGSLADLTSLLQAEQKLVEQAELLNLAHDAIMVRDMDDRVEFWNHGAEVLYGWTAEEAHGRLSADFLHHEEPIDIAAAQRVLLETGVWSGECRHLTKQGGTVSVRSRWTLVRDENGQPKSKLIINTDITAQKKIEEQFLRAQRLESIGTLASGVAHDLNNILVPIMMAAPILRGEMEPYEREKFLDIVEMSAQRGADIIKQVLTFARGAEGDRILLQPIYLLEEVSKIASQTFPKSISLRTCYDENIHMLEADPTQLHQVLLNLCINARDAMPGGGELCLAAENFEVDAAYASMRPGATVGPHVMLEVVDNGTGISKEVIDKIFDPFFTTKGIGQGTGLGLSTVAGIVKSQGGFIDVSSKPGRTSFKIFLPAKAAPNTASPLLTNASVPRGAGQTILLVDDEESIRELAEIILSSHGYKVLVAEDGPAALALFAQQIGRIDVVVTDLAMPGMDGLMLVRTLRRIEPALKIIVSTGRADDSYDAELAALKVDGLLTKPYTNRNLLLKLNHILQGNLQNAA